MSDRASAESATRRPARIARGGWLDGAMGVLYGLEIARSRIESGRAAALGVDAVSFQDEEGTFLPCLGSRSFCGDLSEADVAAPKSASGEPLPAAIARAARAPTLQVRETARRRKQQRGRAIAVQQPIRTVERERLAVDPHRLLEALGSEGCIAALPDGFRFGIA